MFHQAGKVCEALLTIKNKIPKTNKFGAEVLRELKMLTVGGQPVTWQPINKTTSFIQLKYVEDKLNAKCEMSFCRERSGLGFRVLV